MKRLTAYLAALVIAIGAFSASSERAEAGHGKYIVGGIIAGAIIGHALHHHHRKYHRHYGFHHHKSRYRHCRKKKRFVHVGNGYYRKKKVRYCY